tara:strand:- start:481 stop:1623 length:1143 start_codon:yes stop_codon:yes gene_type:complete
MTFKIKFNVPYRDKKCDQNVIKLLNNKNNSLFGFDQFTRKNEKIISQNYKFKNILFTNSCTSALEISALLTYRKNKNVVLMPSYTFTSTASSFLRANFKLKFLDISNRSMMPDLETIKKSITKKTGVIVVVHYAGLSIEDLDKLKKICLKRQIYLVEDAAQALGSYFKNKPLGSFGDLSCFSFHETKNIHCGSGGMLVVNNKQFLNKSHYILERGTDRRLVLQNIKKKYSWVTIGSSFNSTELNSSFLTYQLLNYKKILIKRRKIYERYINLFNKNNLNEKFYFNKNFKYLFNYHCLYIILKEKNSTNFINFLGKNKIQAFIGYVPLHTSPYGKTLGKQKLINTDLLSNKIVRLPIHNYMSLRDVSYVVKIIIKFFSNKF